MPPRTQLKFCLGSAIICFFEVKQWLDEQTVDKEKATICGKTHQIATTHAAKHDGKRGQLPNCSYFPPRRPFFFDLISVLDKF